MTEREVLLSADDLERSIDQLVDDELDAGTRRQLLKSLNSQPGGWKRCALAFLEMRDWRQGLNAFVSGDQKSVVEVASPGQRTSKPARDALSWLNIAAATVLAFGIGWSLQSMLEGRGLSGRSRIADGRVTELDPTQPKLASEGSTIDRQMLDALIADLEQQLNWLDGSQVSQMVHELRRRGQRIQLRPRGVVPYETNDGQQGFVPWGDIEIVPVRDATY